MTKAAIWTIKSKTTHVEPLGTSQNVIQTCMSQTQEEICFQMSPMEHTGITNQDDRGWAAVNCRELWLVGRVGGAGWAEGRRFVAPYPGKGWGNYFLLLSRVRSLSDVSLAPHEPLQTSKASNSFGHKNAAFFHSPSPLRLSTSLWNHWEK